MWWIAEEFAVGGAGKGFDGKCFARAATMVNDIAQGIDNGLSIVGQTFEHYHGHFAPLAVLAPNDVERHINIRCKVAFELFGRNFYSAGIDDIVGASKPMERVRIVQINDVVGHEPSE